ncbi:DUF2802 domain-containing protein [Uliginosibacterium gangwonense]|uniref:DUF2802 domain-containing protein n=1 Tax=Uliginosibacterium gangwonense TaxID=392736 RepID=UPI00036655A1|nr:DUF2802 domain-containing protein [Uliginosibacterium gangwonense]
MTVKEIILGLIVVLLAYLCWLCLQFLATLRKKKKTSLSEMPRLSPNTQAPGDTIQSRIVGGEGDSSSSDTFHSDGSAQGEFKPMRLDESDRRFRPPPEPDASGFGFDALLEMRQTRHIVDDLQRQLAELRTELDTMRRDLANVRSSSRVSSFYSEAVELAQRGYDVQAIAERCGISIAEAEMVHSLSATPNQTQG